MRLGHDPPSLLRQWQMRVALFDLAGIEIATSAIDTIEIIVFPPRNYGGGPPEVGQAHGACRVVWLRPEVDEAHAALGALSHAAGPWRVAAPAEDGQVRASEVRAKAR